MCGSHQFDTDDLDRGLARRAGDCEWIKETKRRHEKCNEAPSLLVLLLFFRFLASCCRCCHTLRSMGTLVARADSEIAMKRHTEECARISFFTFEYIVIMADIFSDRTMANCVSLFYFISLCCFFFVPFPLLLFSLAHFFIRLFFSLRSLFEFLVLFSALTWMPLWGGMSKCRCCFWTAVVR